MTTTPSFYRTRDLALFRCWRKGGVRVKSLARVFGISEARAHQILKLQKQEFAKCYEFAWHFWNELDNLRQIEEALDELVKEGTVVRIENKNGRKTYRHADRSLPNGF